MARFYWCKLCEELHQRVAYQRNCDPEPPQRGDYPMPAIHSDSLPGGVNGLYHHAALMKFDSKSAYRRATREHGCVEVAGERDAFERYDAECRNKPIGKDVIESAVNEALHQHGISSDSDCGKFKYDND